jgi:hypothetical protein
MKPSFIVIGAARSGTTSLFQYLDAHPDIYLSPVKELNFFSNEKYWNKGFKWYESNFSGAEDSILAVGEASPSYTKAPFTEDVPKRIFNYCPKVKLIYIVRNPIERFISHYLHRLHRGYDSRDFESTLKNLDQESFAYQGRYHYQIDKYLKYFDRNQILIIPFESIKSQRILTIKKIYQFLEVNSEFKVEQLEKIHNANKIIIRKNRFGIFILRFFHKHIEQKKIPYFFKKLFISISNIGGTPIKKVKPTSEQLAILENFYKEDSMKLREDFGIQTDHWFSR